MPQIFTSNNKCVHMGGNKCVYMQGGATQLLSGIKKNPVMMKGEGNLGANKMVGIISPAPKIMPPLPYVPNTKVSSPSYEGGELLSKISKISFKNNAHNNKRDNIKFVF